MIEAASFRRTLFLTRVPKGTGRFLMRRLVGVSLIKKNIEKKYFHVFTFHACFTLFMLYIS